MTLHAAAASKRPASVAGLLRFREPFVVAGASFLDVRAQPRVSGRHCAPGEVTLCPGGSARNLAEDLARLGRRVKLFSAVGDDPPGRWLLEATRSAGVDVTCVAVLDGVPTGVFCATTGQGGSVRSAVVSTRARSSITASLTRATDGLFPGAGALVAELSLPVAALRELLRRSRAAGLPVCLEAASCPPEARELIAGADLIKGNEHELRSLTGRADPAAALRAALDLGAGAALVTLGPAGALAMTRQECWSLRHPAASPLDTAGAGDAFLAGLLDASADGAGWDEGLRRGALAARLALATRESSPRELSRDAVRHDAGDLTVTRS